MQQKRQRGKKTIKPHTITKAVTHIRLTQANPGKLAALDALAPVYLALCQQYVTFFCTQEQPDAFHDTLFAALLSERWHRVAIQQAAGIAQSWRTNRTQAYQDYLDDLLDYHEQQTEGTLEFRKPLLIPVKLAAYHKEQITDPKTGKVRKLNTSVQLNKREDGAWWLTLSYDEVVPIQTAPHAPVVGIDVGIANFLTTSDGKHYGSFNGKLRERQKRDREKRRRKAKLHSLPMNTSRWPR